MQKRTARLTADSLYMTLPIGGKQWKLGYVSDKTAKIDISWYNYAGGTITEWPAVEKRASFTPPEGFSSFKIVSDKPVDVEYYITDGQGTFEVDVDLTGQTINVANTAAAPLFVASVPGQSIAVNIAQPNGCADALHVELCTAAPATHSSAIIDIKTLANGGTQFIAAAQNCARFVIRNLGAEPIVLQPMNGGVLGTGAIIVQPYQFWVETDFASSVWYAYTEISDTTAALETANK
jgi:hypothetical protein